MSNEVSRLYIVFDADGSPYIKGLKNIESQTDKSGRGMESSWGKYGKAAGMAAAAGLVVVSAAAVKVGTAVVGIAAKFEYEFSRIKANANATQGEMDALRSTVMQLGKDTAFSAGEAAQGANELIKAGMSVGDVMGALPGMLSLAAAGELGVAQAAEITANNLNTFGLAAKDAGHMADVLANAANLSTTDVTDMGMSLKMSASVAATAGMNIDEVSAALAIMANMGIKGSDAGTSLKSMFMKLQAPSEKAAGIMEEYGIDIYDASGNMYDFSNILGQFEDKLGDATQEERDFALATIMGTDAVRAANILVGEGAEAFDAMTVAVGRSGAAQEIAATKMDNLMGSWEQFKGSLETLAIDLGTKALPQIRAWVDDLTEIVNEAINTGDWGKVAERVGVMIGDAIQTATPYVVDVAIEMAKAAGQAIPVAIVSGITNAPTGSDFSKMRDYLADRMAGVYHDIPRTEAFQKALEDLQNYWSTSLLEGRHMAIPKAKSKEEILALAEAMGFVLGEDSWEVIAESNQDMWTRVVAGSSPTGGLWSPGFDPGQKFRDMAEGISVANDMLEDNAQAAEDAAVAQDRLAGYTDILTSAFDDTVDPAAAWADAISAGEDAAKEAGKEFKITTGTLEDMAAELAEQVKSWADFETNMLTLVDTWGTEFGPEVIMKAAELGPEFVKALVGGDEETVRATLSNLESSLTNNMDAVGFAIDEKYKTIGEQTGTTLGTYTGIGYTTSWLAADVPGVINTDLDSTDAAGPGTTKGTEMAAALEASWSAYEVPEYIKGDLSSTDTATPGTDGGTAMAAALEASWANYGVPGYITADLDSADYSGAGVRGGGSFAEAAVAEMDRRLANFKPTVNVSVNFTTGPMGSTGDLGMGLDEYIKSQYTTSAHGMTPHTTAVWNQLDSAYPSANFIGGRSARPNWKSDHPAGRAFDINGPDKRAYADWAASHFSELGIKYIIYGGQINYGSGWKTYNPPAALKNSASHDTAYHYDHVHISTKYHDGGRVPGYGEQPATLMGGESVLTAEQQELVVRLVTGQAAGSSFSRSITNNTAGPTSNIGPVNINIYGQGAEAGEAAYGALLRRLTTVGVTL